MARRISFRRVSRAKDLVRIEKMHKEGFPRDSIPDFTGAVVWEMRVDKKIAGFTAVKRYEFDPTHAFLFRTYVREQYRGMGLQQRAIKHRLRYLKNNGAVRAYTYVIEGNYAILAALIKCGMRLYNSDWAGEGAYHLEKWL